MIAANKKMSDGYENDRAECRGGERVKESTAENSQLRKDPAADVGTDQAKDDISDASKSASTRDFSR